MAKYFKIPRYTKEAYIETHAIKDYNGLIYDDIDDLTEKWEIMEYPDDIYDQIMDKTEMLEELSIVDPDEYEGAMVVMLDDEYIFWLKTREENIDTAKNRIEYMASIDNKKATKLLLKNKLNYSGRMVFLMVNAYFRGTIRNTRTEYSLNEEAQTVLQSVLEREFPGSDIYVTPYLVSPAMLEGNVDIIECMKEDFCRDGARTFCDGFRIQKWGSRKANLVPLFVPIFIRAKMLDAVCPMNPDFEDEKICTLKYKKELLVDDEESLDDSDELGEDNGNITDPVIVDSVRECIPGSEVFIPRSVFDLQDIPYVIDAFLEAAARSGGR